MRAFGETDAKIFSGFITFSTPFIRADSPTGDWEPAAPLRDLVFIGFAVLSHLIFPDVMSNLGLFICVFLTAMYQGLARKQFSAWVDQSDRTQEWEIPRMLAENEYPIPFLAMTNLYDEAYHLLNTITRIQNLFRIQSQFKIAWLKRAEFSRAQKAIFLLFYPFSPLLKWAVYIGARIEKIAFGQSIGMGMLVNVFIQRNPPPDFMNQDVRFYPARHSILRHSGVYENDDAINAMAEWMAKNIGDTTRTAA
jgi:hypothetical protein